MLQPVRVFIPSVISFYSFFLLSRSSEYISHIRIWSRIGVTLFLFWLSIVSVTVRELIGGDGWWGLTPCSESLVYFTRGIAAIWRLTDPTLSWRTLSLCNNDYYTPQQPLHTDTHCVQLLHIWPAFHYPLSIYPNVYYPPRSVYQCKIGAQVTSRLLTGNGPWHLN